MNKLVAIEHEEPAKSSFMTDSKPKKASQKNVAPHTSCCRIEWGVPLPVWNNLFEKLPQPNLLQSPIYGRVQSVLNHQKQNLGIIYIDDHQAGLIQTLEAGILKNMIHAIIIDRGPLWFKGYGKPDHIDGALKALRETYPKRMGRKIRFIPEIENTKRNLDILTSHGFKPRPVAGYQTVWLDLDASEEQLRKNLKSGWRGSLRKAEKQNMQIEWDTDGKLLPWFVEHYKTDKEQKKYPGASPKLLLALGKAYLTGKNTLIGRATLDGQALAGVLLLCHGNSATYQAGWTTPTGRDRCAHNLLLWNALGVLKERATRYVDLGGVNEDNAKGVKSFKEGMGGKTVETIPLCN